MNIDKLKELRDYFMEIPGENIIQKQGICTVTNNDKVVCGCFGVHSDYFHRFEGRNVFKYEWGETDNIDIIGLHAIDICNAWKRIDGKDYLISEYPYGEKPWPHSVVDTLNEIIRHEGEK